VLMDKYFNRKAPGIVIKLFDGTSSDWYWVFDIVGNKHTSIHWQHMALLEGTQSEV